MAATSEDVDAQRRERVKARWSMLRQALLGSSSGCGDTDSEHREGAHNNTDGRFHVNEHSMNYFPGFRVLDRTILPREEKSRDFNDVSIDCDENWNMVRNSYTSRNGHNIHFFTRETKEQQKTNNEQSTVKSRVEALLSHRNHGVDNTGNVRVWDAEATLAGFLLSVMLDGDDVLKLDGNGQAMALSDLRKNLRSMIISNAKKYAEEENTRFNTLELGAGQAGLAGLSMAAASVFLKGHAVSDDRKHMEGLAQTKPLNVVLSDGHPKCVDNNIYCAKIMPRSELANVQIEARLLLWDSSSKGADACRQLNKLIGNIEIDQSSTTDSFKLNCQGESFATNTKASEGMYQLCLASDCVHFQEFHDGLLATIARTLSVDGVALLCQPRRGTSLQNFMDLIDAVNESKVDYSKNINSQLSDTGSHGEVAARGPLFQMNLFDDFDAKVLALHTFLVSKANKTNEKTMSTMKNEPTLQLRHSPQYDPNRHRPLLLGLQKLRPYDEDIDGELMRHHVKMRAL